MSYPLRQTRRLGERGEPRNVENPYNVQRNRRIFNDLPGAGICV